MSNGLGRVGAGERVGGGLEGVCPYIACCCCPTKSSVILVRKKNCRYIEM